MSSPRHIVRAARDAVFDVPTAFAGNSKGFTKWSVADSTSGSYHMGFGVCELEPGGSIAWHVQAYEESFHVLTGELLCETPEGRVLLKPGDFGMVPVGVPHAWRNAGRETVRWAEMLAPQPNPSFGGDAVWVPEAPDVSDSPLLVDPRDPRTRSFGHIDGDGVNKDRQSQEDLSQSASMRTALLVYSGINVKMMVDSDLGAKLSTMFMVGYDSDGVAGPHDHPFEEGYLILEGELDLELDGEMYHMVPGDAAWAGPGCVHAFTNPKFPVRFLETQAPQPPSRHAYRWVRDWAYLEDKLS
jgi:quercetin dioxygenase-like cupin family protein